MSRVQIQEVGPRDGLQNEDTQVSVSTKVKMITGLVDAGLKRIEVGAFVSPKWVPQMKGSEAVVKQCFQKIPKKRGLHFSALTPNFQGFERAKKSGIKEIAVFGAASESFSKKNINCTIKESFERFRQVIEPAKSEKMWVRGYLSVAFGCPYEGKVSEKKVIQLSERLLQLGVDEISIGDTIGVANPKQVKSLIQGLLKSIPKEKVAMHFHDTRGTALANVLESLNSGISIFDSSVGGLGGCPYAKGASGNLATEDLIYMLEGMGLKTGVDLSKLLKVSKMMEKTLKRKLPSKVLQASK
ncbi:MAG: hydroxymethylglutaryl-CoA lyase [Bdellovibrionaceae bacterium]|nr:hydroxymethylglutaryl-CoA lyase [Pseudobdellovibrionaceae bacterium]